MIDLADGLYVPDERRQSVSEGKSERLPESLHCVVEVPKGTRDKYEWNADWDAIRLDRFLFSSVVYPTDYGFFPSALATAAIRLEDLPSQLCEEIVHFFSIYKQPEGEHVEVDGWYPRDDAMRVIREARERFELAQTTSS